MTDVEETTRRIPSPGDHDFGCGPVIPLTIRRGPGAGRTFVYCTCGWQRTYKNPKKALKRADQHLTLANGAP